MTVRNEAPTDRRDGGLSRQELTAIYLGAFEETIRAYRETRELPPLAAASFDPDGHGNRKLTATGIEYVCDVENATKKALDNNPELLKAWSQIVNGETVPEKLESKIAWACGKLYAARKLRPRQYFRVNLHPTPRKRAA